MEKQIPLLPEINSNNEFYLETKVKKMGHKIDLKNPKR